MRSSAMRFLLFLTLSISIGKSLQTDMVMEMRAPPTCTYKNPEKPLGPSPVQYDGDFVDVITVKFGKMFKERKCNSLNSIKKYYPKVQYKEVGRGAWKPTDIAEGKKDFQFENLNPCAAYEVLVQPHNMPPSNFTIGPYFNEPTVYDPIVDDDNEEYKKSFRRMRTTPKVTSAKFKLTICAKRLQLVVEPEKEQEDFHRSDLVQLDPRNPSETIVNVRNLKACTKYAVRAELSLKNQTKHEFARDNEKYESDDSIAKFWTWPSLIGLRRYVNYDITQKNLSWDFSPFFEQECATPMKRKNPTFLLKIGSNATTVATVRFVLE